MQKREQASQQIPFDHAHHSDDFPRHMQTAGWLESDPASALRNVGETLLVTGCKGFTGGSAEMAEACRRSRALLACRPPAVVAAVSAAPAAGAGAAAAGGCVAGQAEEDRE